jgi:hypothetical protein
MTLKNTIAGNDMSDEPASISLDNLVWAFDTHRSNGEPDLVDHDKKDDPVEAEFRGTVNKTMRGLTDLCRSMGKNMKSREEQTAALMQFAQGVIRDLSPKLENRMRDGQSILHIFAQEMPAGPIKSAESTVYRAFISYFLMSSHRLIGFLDDEYMTPLSAAIKKKNWAFILACQMIPSDQHLDRIREALKAEVDCDDGSVETCLEMAVKKQGLPQEVRLELVKLAPKQAFERANKRGCTPLHLAVAYDIFEKRPADQAALVRALLQYGPEAMRVRTMIPRDLSVYQYQEYTRFHKAKETAQKSKGNMGGPPGTQTPAPRETRSPAPLEPQDHEGGSKGKGPKADEMARAKENPGYSSTAKDGPKDGPKIKIVDKEHAQGQVPQTPVKHEPANGLSSQDDQFNEIKEELKLWYLRNEQPRDAVKYLTIRGQNRNIFLLHLLLPHR